MEQFSREEQASLMLQFLCNVPVMILEDILPRMISFLSPEEQDCVILYIKDVVPKEEPLQEVDLSYNLSNCIIFIFSHLMSSTFASRSR